MRRIPRQCPAGTAAGGRGWRHACRSPDVWSVSWRGRRGIRQRALTAVHAQFLATAGLLCRPGRCPTWRCRWCGLYLEQEHARGKVVITV